MEQRTSYRIPFEEKVQYGYLSRPYFDGTLSNISENGIAVKADNPIPENTAVTVLVYYLNKPIELEGEVKRLSQCYFTNKFEMGISLTVSNSEYNSIYLSMLSRSL